MVNPQGISQEKLPMRREAALVAVLQASPGFTTEEINRFSLQAQGSGNTNSLGNHGSFRFVTGARGSGNTNSLGNQGSFRFVTGKITFFGLQANRVSSHRDRNGELVRRSGNDLTLETLV